MRFNQHAGLPGRKSLTNDSASASASKNGTGKRARGRHAQHTLRCNLGDVMDLSSDGARIRCRRVPTGRTELVIADLVGPGQLHATVVWSKSIGNFHFDVGFKFEKVSRDMAERLQRIAEHHRFRRAI